MRIENSVRNAKSNMLRYMLTILLGLLTRVVFVKFLGSDYLGISGLFSNILSMLALSELGLGTAITYNLYEPLHNRDEQKILGLIRFYRDLYRGIAGFVLCAGSACIPFLHFFIKDISNLSFSYSYIQLIFFVFVLDTAVSYLFTYRTCLLFVGQKQYILVNLQMIFDVSRTVVQVLLLVMTHNYLVYLIVGIVSKILLNTVQSEFARRQYPFLEGRKIRTAAITRENRREVFQNAKNLSIHKFAGYVVNSTDNLLISSFVGVVSLGYFSNYSMLFSAGKSIIGGVGGAMQASLGDLVASGNKRRVREIIDIAAFFMFVSGAFCSISMAMLSTDVVRLLFGANRIIANPVILIGCFNLFFTILIMPIWNLSFVAGLFSQDRKNALIEAAVNGAASLFLVQYFGIAGCLAGTTISYIVGFLLKCRIHFRLFFRETEFVYLKRTMWYCLLCLAEFAGVYWSWKLLNHLPAIAQGSMPVQMTVKLLLCMLIPNGVNYICYRNTSEMKFLIRLCRQNFKKEKHG